MSDKNSLSIPEEKILREQIRTYLAFMAKATCRTGNMRLIGFHTKRYIQT